jgi:vesicle coat complex subunit
VSVLILVKFSHVNCRIKEFSEWAQCIILELASKFLPSDNNEIFDIMNLLEDRLHHANGAVVLATIKVFLHLTMSMTDVHQQVHIFLVTFYYLRCNFLLHHCYASYTSGSVCVFLLCNQIHRTCHFRHITVGLTLCYY